MHLASSHSAFDFNRQFNLVLRLETNLGCLSGLPGPDKIYKSFSKVLLKFQKNILYNEANFNDFNDIFD
jgi:hypothetical protein